MHPRDVRHRQRQAVAEERQLVEQPQPARADQRMAREAAADGALARIGERRRDAGNPRRQLRDDRDAAGSRCRAVPDRAARALPARRSRRHGHVQRGRWAGGDVRDSCCNGTPSLKPERTRPGRCNGRRRIAADPVKRAAGRRAPSVRYDCARCLPFPPRPAAPSKAPSPSAAFRFTLRTLPRRRVPGQGCTSRYTRATSCLVRRRPFPSGASRRGR